MHYQSIRGEELRVPCARAEMEAPLDGVNIDLLDFTMIL